MDPIEVAEEQIVMERIRKKIEDLNTSAQSQYSPIQDHITFTLQEAYFKCAHECFDRRRKQEMISKCVELCGVPVNNSKQHFESEIAKFQERMNRSLMVCQDKYDVSKLQERSGAARDMEACVNDAAASLLGS